MPFATLDQDQQKTFRERLARLDLDETALIADELVVPEGTTMQLSPSPTSGAQPRRLVTKDLDTLRRWIGAPDALADDARVRNLERHLHRFPGLATKVERPSGGPRRTRARAVTAAARVVLACMEPADDGTRSTEVEAVRDALLSAFLGAVDQGKALAAVPAAVERRLADPATSAQERHALRSLLPG